MNHSKYINVPIERLDVVSSTNDYLSELCKQGKTNEFYTIIAEKQISGKGQRGNVWESEYGKNLTFSIVLYPTTFEAYKQFDLSMLVSVSIVGVLTDYTEGFSIKWPNDIYWKDQKICGILIENELEGKYLSQSIIGIGLNINQEHFNSSVPNPVSLYQIISKEINREEIFRKIIHAILSGYKALENNQHEISEALHHLYQKYLYRKNGFHIYRDKEGDFLAEIHHVGKDGCLYLKDEEDTIRKYTFKEITYVLPEQRKP